MQGLSTHAKGFLLTFVGVMVLTPDALLIRLADMDVWQLTFWRNSLMSSTMLIVLFGIHKSKTVENIKAIGKTGILIGILMGLSSTTFVLAFEYASAAKVLITVSLIPILAALLSVVFLKEPISKGTAIACLISFIGIIIVVSDSFIGESSRSETWGIIYALCTAFAMAGTFTLTRSKPSVSMVPATAIGGLAVALAILPFISPTQIESAQVFPVLALGLFVLPASFGLLALGPRYIPAPEVGLLMLLETCLGPFWVWLVLNEQPSLTVLIGGSIVVLTLACHAIWSLKQNRAARFV